MHEHDFSTQSLRNSYKCKKMGSIRNIIKGEVCEMYFLKIKLKLSSIFLEIKTTFLEGRDFIEKCDMY